MKKIAIFSLFLAGFMMTADAAVTGNQRGRSNTAAATQAAAPTATTARAAANQPQRATAARSAATPVAVTSSNTNAARAAAPRTTAARSATPTTTGKSTTVARAGAMQKVVGAGTTVAAAKTNTVVSEACRTKYEGCMDSFCMLDNASGGRCVCSDRNKELNNALAEIEALDAQSYKMATEGVEKIEMGADAEAAIAAANAAAKALSSTEADKRGTGTTRKALDLSLWDDISWDDEDIFAVQKADPLAGKEGDAMHRAAAEICIAAIAAECASDLTMLQTMYSQQIRSDCTAYENDLKKRKSSSQQKLAAAERAMRDAALESLRTANKYDLGQCTVEFKKCMISTGGCKDDFSGCAGMYAMDATNTGSSTSKSKKKSYQIKGAVSNIEIASSTYDAIMSKKPLCESVTKNCVAVAPQVWDTFLREVAPQLKSAELIAENDARQNCIGNISDCFQKACKDTIDPNDPDGSYDMCLSRPGAMLNVCKVPLNACGIDASSEAKADESQIWGFVVARLASMRVDSCTTAVKECLTSEDRCGEDYTQCVGLDTDSIIRMCPYDKLVGCQMKYGTTDIKGTAVYEQLADMVQGIMLNIDNNMLTTCQNAANEAMIKVCGSTEDCNGLSVDDGIGSRSLEYKICEYTGENDNLDVNYAGCRKDVSQITDVELGRVVNGESSVTQFAGVLDGTIYWGSIDYDEEGKLKTVEDYFSAVDITPTEAEKQRIDSELSSLQRSINLAIDAIEADPTVQYCMYGREVQGMKDVNGARTKIGEKSADAARFPDLTKQMRLIVAEYALKAAKDNYNAKYDELNAKMIQDYAKIGERMSEIEGKNDLDARRERGRKACNSFADVATLPQSSQPPRGTFGKFFVTAITGGLILPFAAAVKRDVYTAGELKAEDLIASKQMNQWNYKEVVTSTYTWDTMNCQKCTRSQKCAKTKNPIFGSKYCKAWAAEVEKCIDTQF